MRTFQRFLLALRALLSQLGTAQGSSTPARHASTAIRRASRSSWNNLPPPVEREDLDFHALFTDSEFDQLALGLVPEQMEDKWFIFFEDGWLRFHRSWTGAFIYALRLDGSPAGVRVVDSWVNRNPKEYSGTDTEHDRKLVRFIVDALLLKKSGISFPMPANVGDARPGVVQHGYVGRGFPERSGDDPNAKADA